MNNPPPPIPGHSQEDIVYVFFSSFFFSLPINRGLANPEGPKIEKIQSRLKLSISLENFNLDWTFQSRPSEFPTKIGVWWVARLKFSISLEIFKILNFFNLWALRERGRQTEMSLICSDLCWKRIGTNRKKSEQIGTNQGIPENKERKSKQIGRKLGNRNKSGWPPSLSCLANRNITDPPNKEMLCTHPSQGLRARRSKKGSS